jgi:hypothetical protein
MTRQPLSPISPFIIDVGDILNLEMDMCPTPAEIEFGFPEFAPVVFKAHGPALRLAHSHSELANAMLGKMPPNLNRDQAVIYMLVRMAMTGWVELLLLVGNGAGPGAMKIARGMFESAVMAEYLRRNPSEIDDYWDYSYVLAHKRLKQFPGTVQPELIADIEKNYLSVRARFERNGRVRNQWNRHSIYEMAKAVGRLDQYELPYSIAASMHHGNFEALTAHLTGQDSLDIEQPPSLAWVKQALVSGHVYLLQALDTLNDMFSLGFDSQLRSAGDEFKLVWSKPASSAATP